MVKSIVFFILNLLPAVLRFSAAMWLCLVCLSASAQTEVKHYTRGFSPAISAYLTDVLLLCLDKTNQDYGPYELKLHTSELSSNRSKLETERGVLLDVLFATNWLHHRKETTKVVAIEFPVFFGTLGLRSLIVDEDTEFVRDDTHGFLKKRAGQGAHWMDSKILRANGIQVVEAQNFGALFPMLDRGRFDYLPLSVLEAQQTLVGRQSKHPRLSADQTLKVFYPLPAYLYINADRNDLLERFTAGLRLAQESGALEALFQEHFHEVDQTLRAERHQVIVLHNPFITPEHNHRITQNLLKNYSAYLDLIYLPRL